MHYLYALIGAGVGLIFSLGLLLFQYKDISFYYLAAPYSLYEILFAKHELSVWFVIVYSIILFGLLGYAIGAKWSRGKKIGAITTLIFVHFVLAYLSWRDISPGMFNNLKIPAISIDTKAG